MEALDTYLKKWSLSNPNLIVKTPTSFVYKVTQNKQEYILKILTDTGIRDESNGGKFLRLCKISSVVELFKHDNNALLMDYINGSELRTLCEDGRDDDATKIIGEILNEIHAVPIPDNHGLMSLCDRFLTLLNHAEDAPEIIKRGAKFAKHLLQNQQNISLLHGDIHHENILYNSKHKKWQAIDPKGLVGERAYDCANTLYNPDFPAIADKTRLLRQSEILSNITGIDPQAIINYAFVHGCLSACWSFEDEGHYPEDTLQTARILEDLTDLDYVK